MKSNSIWQDEDDAPELDAAFFEKATYKEDLVEKPNPFRLKGRPKLETPKQAINIRLSKDVLEQFRATGKGWQGRVDLALKEWLLIKNTAN